MGGTNTLRGISDEMPRCRKMKRQARRRETVAVVRSTRIQSQRSRYLFNVLLWSLRTCTTSSNSSFSVRLSSHLNGLSLRKFSKCTGAYNTLVSLPLPSESSPDYIPTLVYQARAHLALNNPSATLSLLPPDSEDVTIKGVSSLARYVAATAPTSSENSEAAEAALEELRDLSVEIEGDDLEASEKDKWLVRVLAGTAFARAGEVEEALETLGLNGGNKESVEACVSLCPDSTVRLTSILRNIGLP